MEKQIMDVLAFQKAANAPLPKKPTLLPKDRAELRQNLLQEEVNEISKAISENSIVDIADGIIDCLYILIGTAHEYGLADRLIILFNEVHSSNMSKVGEDGKMIYREDGKVLKPETYRPPNLEKIIERDFSLYQDMRESTEKLMKECFDDFMTKVYDNIYNRLNKEDKKKFDDFKELENYLTDIINIELGSKDVRHTAMVKVYEDTQEVIE